MSTEENSHISVKQYSITVSMPMDIEWAIFSSWSYYAAYDSLDELIRRISESKSKEKLRSELVNAKRLLQHAATYNSSLMSIWSNPNGKIDITIRFTSFNDMVDFRDTMESALKDAVIA